MAKVLDLKRKVNSLVKKSKVTDEGFSYLCDNCDFECVGRKGIIVHIKDTHEEMFVDLKCGFEETSDKDFQSQLSKLVMNVPFCDKDAKANKNEGDKAAANKVLGETKINTEVTEVEEVKEAEEEPAVKSYPLTLDFMRTIDGRTTRIPNYGSLVGRIARLLAMVVNKEKDEEVVKLTCQKCDIGIEEYKDIFTHIDEEHSDFLLHLCSMFPPARKRMDQFMTRAAQNFELVVPTWEFVEKLQRMEKEKAENIKRIEKEKQAELRKLEMKQKLEEAEKARAEMKKKREEAEKKRAEAEKARMALKRKQEEETKIKEYKMMKIDPNDENAQEKLRCKKEILSIETSLKGKNINEVRKQKLSTRLNDLKEKIKKDRTEKKEKIINKRMETCLENLSPKQLRKLCLEYFNNIENLGDISWPEICESVKIGDDYEFLTDFLGALYEFATFHGKKSFKVGHILVTSKQSDSILEKGLRSVRDCVKKDSWRIPSSWDVDIPEEDLGDEWNRKDDSRLLIAASRFGKNLSKIMKSYPTMAVKATDSSGVVLDSVKKRFGYLLNVYMNRGVAVEEFGNSLYSVDVEEEDDWEEEVETEEDDEVVEIDNNDHSEPEEVEENQSNESKTTNGGDKNGVTDSEKVVKEDEDDEIEEVETLDDDEIEETMDEEDM
eukprot:GFUD01134622.1.p1 GENE.GFUD01134622.1~~GFUD01134622.1.p1  ORF type:complete len:663 (-),score=244.62 GFUD01134622.1:238-2226(-)